MRAPGQSDSSALRAQAAMSLAGKIYLVTGSSDGIGLHTATRLAGTGATVLVHGRCALIAVNALKGRIIVSRGAPVGIHSVPALMAAACKQ